MITDIILFLLFLCLTILFVVVAVKVNILYIATTIPFAVSCVVTFLHIYHQYEECKYCEHDLNGEFEYGTGFCWDKTKPNTIIIEHEKPKHRSPDNIKYVE